MAEGPGVDRVVTMGHHLLKLTGRRAELLLAKETADSRKIKKKSRWSWGFLKKICRSWEQGLSQAGEQGLTGEQQSKDRLKSWGWCGKEAREAVK